MGNNEQAIIVTGGTGNLGIHLSKFLYESGKTVILSSRTIKNAKSAKKLIEKSGTKNQKSGNIIPMKLDLRSLNSVDKFFDQVNTLDYEVISLINNAAVDNRDTIDDLSQDDLIDIMQVNFLSTVYCCQKMATLLKKNSTKGSIVNVSSLLAVFASQKSAA